MYEEVLILYLGEKTAKSLDKIINKIGHFSIVAPSANYSCNGIVRIEKEAIVLQCELSQDAARKLNNQRRAFSITGQILAESVSFYSAYVIRVQTSSSGKNTCTVVDFHFNYLVIGYAESDPIKVHSINFKNTDLSLFFPHTHVYALDTGMEEIIKRLDSIKVSDNIGTVSIFQTISESWTTSSATMTVLPVVSCEFNIAVDLDTAVQRIASVRNLLSFFCNGYIPLSNMSITTMREKMPQAEYEECELIKCHTEKKGKENSIFYINADVLRPCFEKVWEKWTNFYNSARPVTALFYGIVSGSSSGLNEFLNLSQALEVYSDRFRDKEIRKALNKKAKAKITLAERLKDLIELYNSYLGVNDAEKLAQKIAKIRNYYTHYDKRCKTEPSFFEVLSAGHLLRTLLLIVLYCEVGLSDSSIEKAKNLGLMELFKERSNVLLGIQKNSDIFLIL